MDLLVKPGDDVREGGEAVLECALMDTDDLAPPPKKPKSYELGQDLSKLSVDDLKALIDDLKTEIARVEAMHAAKQSSKSAAEAAFKR
jgi:uncharacterized small protein (DUF1192 family)